MASVMGGPGYGFPPVRGRGFIMIRKFRKKKLFFFSLLLLYVIILFPLVFLLCVSERALTRNDIFQVNMDCRGLRGREWGE